MGRRRSLGAEGRHRVVPDPERSHRHLLAELAKQDPAVRADYVRVLDAVRQAVPKRWHRLSGVPILVVTVDGDGEDVEVRVERARIGEIARYGDMDGHGGFAGCAAGAARERLRTSRCAAVAYGERVYARSWGVFRLVGLVGVLRGENPLDAVAPLDTRVHVAMLHRRGPEPPRDHRVFRADVSLPFTRRGRLLRRPAFDAALPAILGRARRYDPPPGAGPDAGASRRG